jgi:choline dehydrogenase-like flavoprotein
MACGGLENPRLLLNMLDGGPLGDPSASRHLGRYFQEHPYATISTIAPNAAGAAYLRLSATYVPDADGRGNWRPFVPVPVAVQQEQEINAASLRFYGPPSALQQYVPQAVRESLLATSYALARNIDEIAYELLRTRLGLRSDNDPGSHFTVYTEVEQAPKSANVVTLSDARDRLGLRTLRLDWRVTADEAKTARVAAQELGRFLAQRRMGRLNVAAWLAADAEPENAADWGFSAHHIGTTRMADGPGYGAVDANLKYFGVDNLYVAGSSVFPSSGYANPTLTITALSYRLAEHIIETLRTA